ncbi:hypothetical protein GGF42_007043 [Coemansia sp. RSA 2424]|nr:hypothetical protein GGF42_007043 [Coemansia sp. RSA 2424]
MDINVAKRPFPLGGIHWSIANRWIIGTKARVFIVTPECAMTGSAREKREVSATIEASSNIEAVCLLEPLSEQYAYDHAMGVLASDSSLRIFAPLGHPDSDNWSQVGSYRSAAGAGHMCAIDCVVSASSVAGKHMSTAVAACGYMSGKVEIVRLDPLEESTGSIRATMALGVDTSQHAICHMAWVDDDGGGGGDQHRMLLLVCTIDGRAGLWQIHSDLSHASKLATIGEQDWRPFTAHCVSGENLVLAKIGTVAIVDLRAEGVSAIQYIALSVSQTIISCVIDECRERIYVAAADFIIFVLSKQGGSWGRRPEEERALRDGMRQTVVKSFTTKFKMSSLVLRSLTLSPNARYLAFAAE